MLVLWKSACGPVRRIIGAGAIIVQRVCAIGLIEGAGGIAKERRRAGRCILLTSGIEEERASSLGSVRGASGVMEERLITKRSVVGPGGGLKSAEVPLQYYCRVTSVRWTAGKGSLGIWTKRQTAKDNAMSSAAMS